MKIAMQNQNITEGGKKGTVETLSTCNAEAVNPWPYRIKLTTDSLRWDSLKIAPSRDFNDHILKNMPEANKIALEVWRPIELSVYDVDTFESYNVTLSKKESFWFEPFPDIGQRSSDSNANVSGEQCSSYEFQETRKGYVYSLQPFRQVIRKRGLKYDQEIGLQWSDCRTVNKMDFSVVCAPKLELHN